MITTTINPESMSTPAATFETDRPPPPLDESSAAILAVLERFPSMRRHADAIRAAGIFRVHDFKAAVELAGHGSGAQHAARFIVTLWSGAASAGDRWTFDVVHAMACWDQDHRAAFLAWAKKPIQP